MLGEIMGGRPSDNSNRIYNGDTPDTLFERKAKINKTTVYGENQGVGALG